MRRMGTGAFCVACCLSLVAAVWPEAAGAAEFSSAASYERTTEQLAEAVAASRQLADQLSGYDVVLRRDPMQPLVNDQGDLLASAGQHGGLSVQGLIWSDERPLVVVEDELFAQGDSLGPYTILKIEPDGVIVKRGQDSPLFIPLDRGLEAQVERPVDQASEPASQPPASAP